jgi:hypothetical protein
VYSVTLVNAQTAPDEVEHNVNPAKNPRLYVSHVCVRKKDPTVGNRMALTRDFHSLAVDGNYRIIASVSNAEYHGANKFEDR